MTIRTQILLAALAVATAAATTAAAGSQRTAEAHLTPAPHVLLVGSWHGKAGEFGSIEAAVEAARPGDWVLIGPGDYHERPGSRDGVRITTANLHLRGMSRTGVVIDGPSPALPIPATGRAAGRTSAQTGRDETASSWKERITSASRT